MGNNYFFIKFSILLSLYILSSIGFPQVAEQWVKKYNAPADVYDYTHFLATDVFGKGYETDISLCFLSSRDALM